MTRKLVLCDCLGSQKLNAETISQVSGLACSRVYSSLCSEERNSAAKEMVDGEVTIACQQEKQFFSELAEELECASPGFVDLRDRAGWGEGNTAPKMAALAAESIIPIEPEKVFDVRSAGSCLVLGGEAALEAAAALCETLAVTVLLADANEIPTDRRFDCVVGTLKQASGALGGFRVKFDNLRQLIPGGRGNLQMSAPEKDAVSECDIILDLSGQTPLFPADAKREGYLRADPAHAPSVAKAVFEASHLVGIFEKPLYVGLDSGLCAHSRAGQPACSNCLSVCPTGAITSAGDNVELDPMICAGCGSCSAVCPSGAISYDAPPVESIFRRLNTLASAFRKAGGTNARLLVHDTGHGREMISLVARFGRGLPAEVIPFEVAALAGFGHAEMLAALACGFTHIDVLLGPDTERAVPAAQADLALTIAGAPVVDLLDLSDPDMLCDILYGGPESSVHCEPVIPIGSRRQITRLAASALRQEAEVIELPDSAPYGAVIVDTEACTLCLSCVSLCPSGALVDNPDLPQLRFQENACLQCGLCRNICPEDAITLKPQLNLTADALSQTVLHDEEPYACIECGELFGVKSTIERISEKLAGKHSAFSSSQAADLIRKCNNCRIQAQFRADDNPFQGGERPRVRTTDDYLKKPGSH